MKFFDVRGDLIGSSVLAAFVFQFFMSRLNVITFNIKNFKFPSQISGNHGDSGHLGFCLGWPEGILQLTLHHSRWLNVLFLGLHTLWRAQSSSTSSFKLI